MQNNYGQPPYGVPSNTGYPGNPVGFPGQGLPPQASLYPHLPPQNLSYPNAPYPMPQAVPSWQPVNYPAPSAPTVTQFLLPSPSPGLTGLQWVPTTTRDAHLLNDRALVGGYEGHDGSPLWIIRSRFEGDLIPGKMPIKHKVAYVPWGGNENLVHEIEVLCAPPEKVRWVPSGPGSIQPNMVQGGQTSDGEPLYIGRAKEQGSLTPGKIHPSHGALYISFAGKEVAHKQYEVLVQC